MPGAAKGTVLIVVAALSSLAACLRVDADGFKCGSAGQCPPGFNCRMTDHRCYREAPDAHPDGKVASPSPDKRLDSSVDSGAPDARGDAPDASLGRAPDLDGGADHCVPGICPLADGVACVVGRECKSGSCVDGLCCESACSDPCRSCNQSGKGGKCAPLRNVADPVCAYLGGTCDGEGACRRTNGRPCSGSTDCASGYCVGAVCCESACADPCVACDQGSMAGTCVTITSASCRG